MGHWRDGGIGNMAGSDDREAEEFTLLEQMAVLLGHSKTDALFDANRVMDEAFNFIEALTAAARRGEPLPMPWAWQLIETAPIEPYKPDSYNAPFRCLVQLERGYVTEGAGYWVLPGQRGASRTPLLRWRNSTGMCQPKYWMPLPAPKED